MNPSTALAGVIVRALPALGVRHVVLCPGSRSAPLVYALAEQSEVPVHVRLDERSAGFVALGLGRAGSPAAVVTTSGTAVANLYPAVLEASHAGVPLVVLSADRPHELRGTGANQTTDQVKIFGTAVRWFGEVPAGPGDPAGWRNVLARAVAAATGAVSGDPGPVQLNLAFALPLVPSEPVLPPADPAGLTTVTGAGPAPVRLDLAPDVPTVVLAGDGAGPDAAALAHRAGWPLLAEPSSGARVPGSVGAYRLLLESQLGRRIRRVVVFGRPTLSRPVSRLLSRPEVEVVAVSRRPDWTDPSRRAVAVVPALEVEPGEPGPWSAEWAEAHKLSSEAVHQVLDAGPLTGPAVARVVDAVSGPSDALVVGSSNPIRDLDLVASGGAGAVHANRGLAGIDGTVSTALGVAFAGPGGVTRCLLGDLTFLHDAGGLAHGVHETSPQVQYVVVDDAGGGIFGLLEQGGHAARGAAEKALFERFFATPQQVDLAALALGYSVGYRLVDDLSGLRGAVERPGPGLELVHVRVDRSAEKDLNDRIAAAVRSAVP